MDSFGTITEEVINIFGKNIIVELIKQLQQKDKVASGKLIDSFNFKLSNFITQFLLEFSAEDYLQFIESGRKPGTYPPIAPIREWCRIKGIGAGKKGIEYAIQKSIYKFGIKPVPTISEVVSSSKLGEYANQAEKLYSYRLENYVSEIVLSKEK